MTRSNELGEVWRRLSQGQSLEGLTPAVIDGRIDVRGLSVPAPVAGKSVRTPLADVAELSGLTIIRNAVWTSLDFSGSDLKSLRFFDCTIENCVFAKCQCRDWRMWGTKVSDTSFDSADLRDAALGGVQNGKRNQFRKVTFAGTDLRRTAYEAAEFVQCVFKNAKLDKVDFQTTVFKDCVFEGELSEVLFYRTGFRGEQYPPNEMEGVDFSRARLRFVEFRRLDLDRVRLPTDSDHIILRPYRDTLERLIRIFAGSSDESSGALAENFKHMQKWAGQRQMQGVLNRDDLIEVGGEEGLRRVLEVLKIS